MKRNVILIVVAILVIVGGKLVIDKVSDVEGFVREHSEPEETNALSKGLAAPSVSEFPFERFKSAESALDSATKAAAQGFDAESQEDLKQAIALSPNNPDVLLAEASRSFDQQDFSNALAVVARVLKQNPTNAAAMDLQGAAQVELGHSDVAEVTLQNVVTSEPTNAVALHQLGKLKHRLGKFDEARKFYVRSLTLNPEATDVFDDLHELLRDEAKESEFPTIVRHIIEQNPKARSALLRGLAKVAAKKNDVKATERLLSEAQNGGPATLPDLLVQAGVHYRTIDPTNAVDLLNRAIALAPNDSTPLVRRAFANAMLGRTNEAVADLSSAFVLGADFDLSGTYESLANQFDYGRSTRENRMRNWDRLFNFPRSLEFIYQAYDEAERRHPERGWYIDLQRAIERELHGYKEEAMAAVNRSLAAHPTAAAYYQKALNYRDLMRYDDALAQLDAALRIDPANPKYWTTKGKILYTTDKVEAAWKAYKEALYHKPDYHPADLALRDMWLVNGEYRGLDRDYNELIKRRPAGEFYFRFHRAYHLLPLAKYGTCLADLTRALELRPGNEGARRLHAWTLKFMGRYDEALTACDDLKRYDFEYHAGLLRSTIYVETGKNKEALEEVDKLLKEGFDTEPALYQVKFRALANLNRIKEAKEADFMKGRSLHALKPADDRYVWNIQQPGSGHVEWGWFSLFTGDSEGSKFQSEWFTDHYSDQRSRCIWMTLVGYFARWNEGRFDEATEYLNANTSDADECTWPYPMVRYLKREIPAEVVIAKAQEMRGYARDKTNQPQLGDGHEVLIRTFLGMEAFANSDWAKAKEQFQWVADHPDNLQLLAYHYAKARLADLAKRPASLAVSPASAGPQIGLKSSQTANLSDGLMAYLPLTEDLNDHSANAYSVTVHGSITLEDGAARFPGDGNFLELPHVPLQEKDFSVSLWVRVSGTNDTCTFFSQKEADSCGATIYLQLRRFTQLYMGFWANDVTAPSLMDHRDGWNHLVFQYVNFRQQIWLNGRLLVERVAEPLRCAAGGTRIGGQPPKWKHHHDLEGWMKDFRIYDRALNQTEIRQLAEVDQKPGSTDEGTKIASLSTPPVATANTDSTQSTSLIDERPFLQIDGNHLIVSGPPVQVYELQATFDLTDGFTPLVTLTNATGSVGYVDPEVSLEGNRFYRVEVISSSPLARP